MKQMGDRVKKLILTRNISTVKLAQNLGIKLAQLNAILNNRSLSTLTMLQKIAAQLDVPSDYLLQDFDETFLAFAIDDYLQRIDKDCAGETLREILQVLENGESQNG